MMSGLVRCSHCGSEKLTEFFGFNVNTGCRFKTCDTCRIRPKAHTKVLCAQCNKKYVSLSHLDIHIKAVHDKIRDHECTQCNLKFSQLGNLNKHIAEVHNQSQDYVCTLLNCGLKFARRDTLDLHIKGFHERIRDIECPNCTYKTSYRGHLKSHIEVCTGGERMSKGESIVKGVLEDMKVSYQQEMRFIDCKDVRPLPFDFFMSQHAAAIEFDGRQHFEPVSYWGGQETLEQIQRRDAIKNAYCATNNIRLLRIKYTDSTRIRELIETFLAISIVSIPQREESTSVI